MNTAVLVVIVVALMLLAVGIVLDNLFRLRDWLKQAPPSPKLPEPPDEDT